MIKVIVKVQKQLSKNMSIQRKFMLRDYSTSKVKRPWGGERHSSAVAPALMGPQTPKR